jgi:hypothetical protein
MSCLHWRYCVVKIELYIDWIMFRKALYNSSEDPLDNNYATNISNYKQEYNYTYTFKLCVHNCSCLRFCFPSHVVTRIKINPALLTQKILKIIDLSTMFRSLFLNSKKCYIKITSDGAPKCVMAALTRQFPISLSLTRPFSGFRLGRTSVAYPQCVCWVFIGTMTTLTADVFGNLTKS